VFQPNSIKTYRLQHVKSIYAISNQNKIKHLKYNKVNHKTKPTFVSSTLATTLNSGRRPRAAWLRRANTPAATATALRLAGSGERDRPRAAAADLRRRRGSHRPAPRFSREGTPVGREPTSRDPPPSSLPYTRHPILR
jgi:hypothetical protein